MCEKLSATLLSVVMLFCVRNCCFSSLSLFSHRETERCGKCMPEEEFFLLFRRGGGNHTGWSQWCRNGGGSDLAWLTGNGGHCHAFAVISGLLSQSTQRRVTGAPAFKVTCESEHMAPSAAASSTWRDLSRVSPPFPQRQCYLLLAQTLKEPSSAALVPLKNTQRSWNQRSQRDFYDF